MRCNILLILGLLFSINLSSQIIHFDRYSVQEGLSQSTIYCLTQDNEGYLWLGNASGVSRFDGNEFYNYSTLDGIAGDGVRSILCDQYNRIWLGHKSGGVSVRFDGEYEIVELDSLNIESTISSIVEDSLGRIWISSAGNGVYRINDPDSLKVAGGIDHFLGGHGLSDRVFQIYKTRKHELFFVTDAGLKKYNQEKDEFEGFSPEGMSTFFQITTLLEDSRGNMWYGTYNGGLYRQNAGTNTFKIFDKQDGLGANWISGICEDNQGRIWVIFWGGGVSRITGDKIVTYGEKDGLIDPKVFSILLDREGNIIIGTKESGIAVYKGDHFLTYTEETGLSGEQVWATVRDKYGKLWIGTSSGITILDEENEKEKYSYINVEQNNFIDDNIVFLEEDLNGDIWVGTANGGLIKIDPSKPHGPYFYPGRVNSFIQFNLVTALEVDKDNNLWVGTIEGLIYYEIDKGTMNYIKTIHGLAGNDIREIYCDNDNVIWVGCAGKGITKIDGTEFSTMKLDGEITPNCIKEDSHGNLWIGTEGHGLLLSNNKESVTETFTEHEDGLLTNFISSLVIDDKDNIWLGTSQGLNKYDRKLNQVITYTESDGFTGIEAKPNASYIDKTGDIWFGTVKGLIQYIPKRDKTEIKTPVVSITGVKVNLIDKKMESSNDFNYNESSFFFNYHGLYLTNPKSIIYRYKLEGLDLDWSEKTTLNFANYPSLQYGKYTFKVMSSNTSGKWSEVASYSFTINPPFWKTWWFYIFSIVFVGSWIVFLIKKREENLIREKKILEDKVAERTAELAAKNKDITDSIRYAERIQRAILPPDQLIKSALPDSFVFYRPKDIVSGDFYWITPTDEKVLFSAIDCTGHGVPGAFMSIVGHNLLDKIVKEEKLRTPSDILDRLNTSVSNTLRQTSERDTVKDGMDMALLGLDYKNKKLEYSGAHNAMYIFRDGEIIETKANRFAIGSFIRGEKRKFDNHVFDVIKDDVIYIFSDGYPDQFGGENGKKYKYKPFKEFLHFIHKKDMSEQHRLLEEEFIRWLGDYDQIDDVIVIGVRV